MKIPGPISAAVSREPGGHVVVEFRTDSGSPYNWGKYDENYGVYSVEMPASAAKYASDELRDVEFTFMEPESSVQSSGALVMTMPKGLVPPLRRAKRRATVPYNRESGPAHGTAPAPPPPPTAVDTYALVSQLNAALAQDARATVELRAGRVVVRQTFG